MKCAECIIDVHHLYGIGVHDGRRESPLQYGGEEGGGHDVSLGKTEGNIGHTERGVGMKLVSDPVDGTDGGKGGLGIRGDGHGKRIKDQILSGNTVLCGTCDDLFCNPKSGIRILRDSVFVQSKCNDKTAVLGN